MMRFFRKLMILFSLSLISCGQNNDLNYWAKKGIEIAKTNLCSEYVDDNYYFTYCAYNFVEYGYDIPNTFYCELTYTHNFQKNIVEVGTLYFKYTKSSSEVMEIPSYLINWTRNGILNKTIIGSIGFINSYMM